MGADKEHADNPKLQVNTSISDHLYVMGLLMMSRNQDAQSDCKTVIMLDPANVKALFRRGQARIRLNRLIVAQKGMFHPSLNQFQ